MLLLLFSVCVWKKLLLKLIFFNNVSLFFCIFADLLVSSCSGLNAKAGQVRVEPAYGEFHSNFRTVVQGEEKLIKIDKNKFVNFYTLLNALILYI